MSKTRNVKDLMNPDVMTVEPDRFVTDSPAHLVRGMLRAWPWREGCCTGRLR